MHIPTHILSGWCVGNLVRLSPRQRAMCMVAALAPDLDGVSWLAGEQAFWHYHHMVCHNLPFGIIISGALALYSGARLGIFFLYLGLFHLHLLMDFFGSGPGWPIYYLWPFSHRIIDNRYCSWEFFSWQNLSFAAAFLAWTALIWIFQKRTPLEWFMPDFDRRLTGRTSGSNPAFQPITHEPDSTKDR